MTAIDFAPAAVARAREIVGPVLAQRVLRGDFFTLKNGSASKLVNNDTANGASYAGTVTLSSAASQLGGAGNLALSGILSTTGGFASFDLPTLATGLSWDTSALYTTDTLSVSGSAIPEPGTCAAIFGAAALGLAAWRRRPTAVRK